MSDFLQRSFDLSGKTAVVTGGGGVLCSSMCVLLAELGARVAVLDIRMEAAQAVVQSIIGMGWQAQAFVCNVLEAASVTVVVNDVVQVFGSADILINGAGGNKKGATTSPEVSFFDLPPEAVRDVFDLNFIGTLLPCQAIGRQMARQGQGVILNIASMNAFRPLTRIPAYSAAKAAVTNFTQWLAVHMAQEYSPHIRVNAIAPGFFRTEQNRYLLTDAVSGELTPRGKTILSHTPMGRFGDPFDLLGTVAWLVSPASEFISGVVVPVDGGFNAYGGV
jgi:NAD(P)-dependent dehydrogenase (short-subunit alcohol dehydrogenase family)